MTDIDYEELAKYVIGVMENGSFVPKYRYRKPDPDETMIPDRSSEHIDFINQEIFANRENLYVRKDGVERIISYLEFMAKNSMVAEVRAAYYLYKIVKETWLQRQRRKVMKKIYEYAGRYLAKDEANKKSYERTEEQP